MRSCNAPGRTCAGSTQAIGLASDAKARAVVIEVQADLWDLDGKAPSHIGAYRQFVDSIALHTLLFAKPVLLLNGDSHGLRSDNPLRKGDPCVTESGAGVTACVDDACENQPYDYDLRNFLMAANEPESSMTLCR